jgi:hypothetical protein
MFATKQKHRFDRSDDALRPEPIAISDMFHKIIAETGERLRALRGAGAFARIDRLVEAGAWTDAALALIEIELPSWRVRRLVCEDGEWVCSLSRQPNLPFELDDMVSERHEVLPLAILRAFLEARRRAGATHAIASTVPHLGATPDRMFCCENFLERRQPCPVARLCGLYDDELASVSNSYAIASTSTSAGQ